MFKKKIKIKAITSVPMLVDMFPIILAKDCKPEWFNKMPVYREVSSRCPVRSSFTNRSPTIRGCHGVGNLLKKGFVIRAWEDMSIFVYPDGEIAWRGARSGGELVTMHDKNQLPDHMSNKRLIKLNTPWSLYGDSTEYMFMPAIYHNDLSSNGIVVPHGVLDYKNQHASSIFLVAEPKPEVYEIFIKAGTPLAHVVPLSDREVVVESVFDKDFKENSPVSFFFFGAYRRSVNAIKEAKK